ncbi:MAG: S41 family peptidase [Balneolaceae bacterium]
MTVKKLTLPAVLLLLVLCSLAWVRSNDLYFEIRQQLAIFSELYREVATRYVDEIPPRELMEHGIRSMLDMLDPYTEFITEGEQQQMEILSTGTYGGVGIEAGTRGGHIVVIAPLEGYPAERAGIRPGDYIIQVNGVTTEGMTPVEVQQLLVGDPGLEVVLEIERPGVEEAVRYELERERIEVANVTYSARLGSEKSTGYIQIGHFGQNVSEELRQILVSFLEEGELTGLILDLRNNPGGLLHEAVRITDKFVDPGILIVETRGRVDEERQTYTTEETALLGELPLVILINRGSASASEVVAGALQDLDRAVILGETSFGKGLVQTIRPLPYNRSMKLTVSRYYIPSGRGIQSATYNHNGQATDRVEVIADSLRREFRTKNGRVVFDGMGIEPDIVIRGQDDSLLEMHLKQKNHYFFFINDLLSTLSSDQLSAEPPENLFDLFKEYLETQEFEYETSADRQLVSLEEAQHLFADTSRAQGALQELGELLRNQKENELHDNRHRIEQELHLEWVSRLSGSKEGMKASLPSDRYIQQALSLLSSRAVYDSILNP